MDENLLTQLRKNPEVGLNKLMDKYIGYVYTIVYNKVSLVCTKEDIEECVSTIFYEFFDKRNDLELEKGSIKAFLAVVARRRAIDTYRVHQKSLNKVVYIDEDSHFEREVIAESQEVDSDTKATLIESIKSLGEPDSEIFIRKYYFGQNTKIIAKILGIKENTIDKKVSRGLIKLREALGGVF